MLPAVARAKPGNEAANVGTVMLATADLRTRRRFNMMDSYPFKRAGIKFATADKGISKSIGSNTIRFEKAVNCAVVHEL
jgi:hypothetical protein